MNITFDGQVAVVTGAASGIGLTCAELLAESGAKVALLDVNATSLEKATDRVQSKGVARGFPLDLKNVPAISSAVREVRQKLGEIDILVSCAGVAWAQTADTIAEADWDTILDVNAKGLFFCSQAIAVQSMIPRKQGSIVHISSMTGLVGLPVPLMNAHYHASKAAVIGLTKQCAVEWAAHNIRVNAVAPCFVATPLVKSMLEDPVVGPVVMQNIPLGRVAMPEDIAAAVCFLASDAARMITGITLPVDGGWTAR